MAQRYYETTPARPARPVEDIDAALRLPRPQALSPNYSAYVTVRVLPLTDIHLDPRVPGGFEPRAIPSMLTCFMAIAALILGVACVNFTTLAQSAAPPAGPERSAYAKPLGAEKTAHYQAVPGGSPPSELFGSLRWARPGSRLLPTFNA